MSELLAEFTQKDKELDLIIPYLCPIMDKEYYFRKSNLADEQIVMNGTKSMDESNALIATYLYYNCDDSGKIREDWKNKELRKKLKRSEAFSDHCTKALIFIGQHKPQDKDEYQREEIDNAKKPFSPTTNGAS